MPRKYGGASRGMKRAIKAAGGLGSLTSADLQRIQRKSRGSAIAGAAAGSAVGSMAGKMISRRRRRARMAGERGQLTDQDVKRYKGSFKRPGRLKRKPLMGR